MFIIRRLKKLPIYDLFQQDQEGWQGWARISLTKDDKRFILKQLDGRHLTQFEKTTALSEILL